jgi:hypothetical protein
MNLIYYTIGSNNDYVDLLELNIKSLEKFYFPDIELLIITDTETKKIIESKIFTKFVINYKILSSVNSLNESSYNKFKIYDFDEINKYEKIIYCDTDILWNKSPYEIFNKIDNDSFYVSNENSLMSEEWWGGNLLNDDEKLKIKTNNIMGFSAGFFAFKSNKSYVLKEIEEFMMSNIKLMNLCIEQPYFNTFLFRNNLYNTDLNKVVTHSGYNLSKSDMVVIHFAGGPGNYTIKKNKMLEFYNTNIL